MSKLKTVLFDYNGTLLDSRSLSVLVDDASRVLAELKRQGYQIGLVTAATDPSSELDRFGVAAYFDVIIAAKDLTKHKPDPEGIHLALERLKASPEEAIYIGDTPSDMYAAKAAGLRASIGVTFGAANRRELQTAEADYIIDTLPDIFGTIQVIEQ